MTFSPSPRLSRFPLASDTANDVRFYIVKMSVADWLDLFMNKSG